jgi:regulator of cell morphogenesis and NO signaling
MTITEQTTVGAIAAAIPSSVRVFARHAVDFCCGGSRPLAAVCGERGLSFSRSSPRRSRQRPLARP